MFADQTEGLVSSPSMTRMCPPFLRGLVSPLPPPTRRRRDGGGGGSVRIAWVATAGYTENDFLSGTFFNGLENVDWHTARLFFRQGVSTLQNLHIFEFPLKALYLSFF